MVQGNEMVYRTSRMCSYEREVRVALRAHQPEGQKRGSLSRYDPQTSWRSGIAAHGKHQQSSLHTARVSRIFACKMERMWKLWNHDDWQRLVFMHL